MGRRKGCSMQNPRMEWEPGTALGPPCHELPHESLALPETGRMMLLAQKPEAKDPRCAGLSDEPQDALGEQSLRQQPAWTQAGSSLQRRQS